MRVRRTPNPHAQPAWLYASGKRTVEALLGGGAMLIVLFRGLRERWRRWRDRRNRLDAARYATGYSKDAGPPGAG